MSNQRNIKENKDGTESLLMLGQAHPFIYTFMLNKMNVHPFIYTFIHTFMLNSEAALLSGRF